MEGAKNFFQCILVLFKNTLLTDYSYIIRLKFS